MFQHVLAVVTLLNSDYKCNGLPAGPTPHAARRLLLATDGFDGQGDIVQQLADSPTRGPSPVCKNLRKSQDRWHRCVLQERNADCERVDPLLKQEPGVLRSHPLDPRKSKKQLEDARAALELVLSDAPAVPGASGGRMASSASQLPLRAVADLACTTMTGPAAAARLSPAPR